MANINTMVIKRMSVKEAKEELIKRLGRKEAEGIIKALSGSKQTNKSRKTKKKG